MKHMTRTLFVLLLTLLLVSLFVIPTAANDVELTGVVFDNADVLTPEEEAKLTALATRYHNEIGDNRIVVVITDDYDSNIEAEAKKLGFTSRSDSCYMLVIFVSPTMPSDLDTYTLGDMHRFISDREFYSIHNDKTLDSHVKSDRFYDASAYFIERAGEASLGIAGAKTGRVFLIIGVALVIGLAAGGLSAFLVWKSYNKKNRSASYPLNDYTRLYLSVERDIFLDKSVIRTRISSGSKGGRRGGGGGFSRMGGGGRSGGRH